MHMGVRILMPMGITIPMPIGIRILMPTGIRILMLRILMPMGIRILMPLCPAAAAPRRAVSGLVLGQQFDFYKIRFFSSRKS